MIILFFFCYKNRMYCLKCKRNTNSKNITYSLSKNNKPMKRANCTTCGSMKTQFVSVDVAKKGGFIFTIPALLGAAGALGSLAGGAAGIATAVNKKKADDKLIKETIRHNKAMEGKGLFLKPYKTGKGLFLKPSST